MAKLPVLVVSGPTATGKTSQSIALAQSLQGEIINFDSLCFYQELLIGTARPTELEMQNIPHHLMGSESIQHPLNARDFELKARPLIDAIHIRQKLPILVGGSGFYLRALLQGMYESVTTPIEIRLKSDLLYQEDGIRPFRALLEIHDPKTFHKLHENDHYRLRRAVEHFWVTGIPLSSIEEKKAQELSLGPSHPWHVIHLYLDFPKSEHWELIATRTQKILNSGLIEEVRSVLDQGFDKNLKPLQSIGYKETIAYLEGEIPSVKALEEQITIHTRQLAKAQRTWFNKIEKLSFVGRLEQKSLLEKTSLLLKSSL